MLPRMLLLTWLLLLELLLDCPLGVLNALLLLLVEELLLLTWLLLDAILLEVDETRLLLLDVLLLELLVK